jgi:multidrug efflux pump subunit AcrA (membrane-fusion protein)
MLRICSVTLAQLDPSTYQARLADGGDLLLGLIGYELLPVAALPNIEAVIKADQAAIEYVKTELSYTKLVAPFDGVAGIRLLDVGNINSATVRSMVAAEVDSPIFEMRLVAGKACRWRWASV